jgi:flap endonuclease-1
MGIRMLNKFLQSKCKNSISSISLSSLSGKKIVVDISIYMYKYLGEDALLENLYLMISIFRENKITPIFIFDGKPPMEKNDTIATRKQTKKNAREEYYRLKQILSEVESISTNTEDVPNPFLHDTTVELDEDTIIQIPTTADDIRTAMEQLKKKFVILKYDHIQNAKTLLQAYGMTYFEAPGEADILCAKLVSKNIVYACLSEDTDMFVYGCNRVLRYLSLTSSTVIMYDFQDILKTLNASHDEFMQMCIIFGCDYFHHDKSIPQNKNKLVSDTNSSGHLTIYNAYKLFKKYKELQINEISPNVIDFYDWIVHENSHLESFIKDIREILSLFDISSYENLDIYDQIKIMNGPINRELLIQVMEKENFIFLKK